MTPEAFRSKIAQIVQERSLCMNSNKWNALRRAMLHEMPFPPETISAEEEFVRILKHGAMPYDVQNSVYCIYGYR